LPLLLLELTAAPGTEDTLDAAARSVHLVDWPVDQYCAFDVASPADCTN
jgi:hypothetical protein